ncbi:phage tail tape measure protein [Deinococcus altitudinis]|uniref:phage tail tape measure protein n=1 Tax=Deinococcus altitudinis TaxID=468914 RepID=UPI003891F002
MPSKTVSYTLEAAATGVEAIREVRREIEAIAAIRFHFEGQLSGLRAAAQEAAQVSSTAQVQATKAAAVAERQASAERLQQLREHKAATEATLRLQTQASQTERASNRETIESLNNQQRAYRNMWQARQLNDQQVISMQQRIQGSALQQAASLDHTSDAYRRLTQVAAAAQRTIDSAQGVNTPGGFSSGVSQGIQSVLSQYGVAGNLLSNFVDLISAKRAASVNNARGVGQDTIGGLIQGMRGQRDELERAAKATADSVEAAVKKELDIHSPSRVMEYLGRMAGLGFASGISSTRDEALRAANGLSTAAQSGVKVNTGSNVRSFAAGSLTGIGALTGGLSQAAQISSTSTALDGLNKQLQQNAVASQAAATAGVATEVSTEALGASVEGAAEHVQSFTGAMQEHDPVAREAAMNEAKTALAFTVTAAAAAGLAAALVVSYNTAADFEQAMNKAGATTEATGAQMRSLEQAATSRQLEDIGINGLQAASGIEELGSQGLSTGAIIDGGLVTSMKLAKAISADVAVAAGIAASSVKAFGLENKDLAMVADVTTNAVNGTSIKIENFGDAIAAGGSQAKSSRLDFAQFTAIISFMTDKAVSASEAGTSLKSFLVALAPTSKTAKDEMQRLGFSAFDSQGKMKDLAQIVTELQSKFGGMTDQQRLSSQAILFGTDGVRVFNALMEQGATGLQDRIDLLTRMGSTDRAVEKQMAGVRGEQEKFNAALKNLGIVVGESFLPAGTKILNWARDTAGYLKDAVTALERFQNTGALTGDSRVFNLATWLQRSGLKKDDLSPQQIQEARELLAKMQNIENSYRAGNNVASNLPLPNGVRGAFQDANSASAAREIAQLGVKLSMIQQAASGGYSIPGISPAFRRDDPKTGQDVVALLGVANRTILNEFNASGANYHHDGFANPNAVHHGVDYAAPRGTPIYAPFTGGLTIREDPKNGKIFVLADTAGNKLMGLHLDQFSAEVQAAIARGGGKALISKGMQIGTVGNSGKYAGATPHLHIEGILLDGTKADFRKINFNGATNTAVIPKAGLPDPTTSTKPFQSYIAEAQRLEAAVKRAQEAGNNAGWRKAKDALEAFKGTGKDAADAIEWLGIQETKASKAASVTAAELQKYGRRAQQLALQQATAAKSTDPEVQRKADADLAAWVKVNGASAEKVEQYYAASLSRRTQNEEQATKDQEQAARTAAQRSTSLAADIRSGNLTAAQQALTEVQGLKDKELAAATNSAQKRLEITARYATLEYQAQEKVAARTRDNAIRDAQNKYTDDPANLKLATDNANSAYTNSMVKFAVARDKAISSVEQQSHDKRVASQKAQTEIVARLTDELRQGNIQKAQDELTKLGQLRDADLAGVKDNAVEKLRITKMYAQLEYDQTLRVADAVRLAAIRKAENDHTRVNDPLDDQAQQAATDAANLAYENAKRGAGNTRDAAVTQATDLQTSAIQKQRAAYSTLADSLRQHLEAGDLDSKTQQELMHQFNVLGVETEKLGLTNDQYVKGARVVTYGLSEQGHAAYLTAQRMQGMVSGNDEAANSALQLATELQAVGDEQGGLTVLQETYDDLNASLARGEASAASVDKVRVALEALRESVTLTADFNTFVQGLTGSLQDEMGQIADKILDPKTSNKLRAKLKSFQMQFSQDASTTLLQAARDTNAQAGDAVTTQSEFGASDIDAANHDFVTGLFKGPDKAAQASSFLGQDGVFGNAFWSQLGEQGRGEFLAELGKLTPDDFKGMSSATLKGLIESIGSNPDWAELKKTVQAGLNLNSTDAARSASYSSLGDLLGKGQGALDDLNSGKTTASEYARIVNTDLIPALQLISSTTADSGVKEMADKAIAALSGEAAEAQKLVDVLMGVKLAQLDVDRSAGKVSEKNYIDQRQKLQTDQENGGYSEVGFSGQALLVHQKEHEAKLTQISTEGDKARADLTLRLETQTLATQNQRDSDALNFQHDQHLLSDAAFQQAQETQQATAAQATFNLKVKNMKKDSEEYRVEAAQLEVDLTKIRNQGVLDRMKLDAGQSLLDSQKQTLQSLSDAYNQGGIGQVDLSAQAIVLAQSLDQEAAAAERAGRLVLASQFREQAAAARELAGPLGVLAEKLNDYSKYADYVGEVAGAFGKLTGALGEGEQEYDRTGKKMSTPMKDLAANLNGVEKAAQLVSSALTDVGKIAANPADIGSWVHLAVSVISSIADAIGGFKKAYAQAKQTQEDFNAGFTLIDGDNYSKSFVRSRGFLADVFGGGPEVVQEIDKVGLVFAKTMEQGFVSGITGGLKDALNKNDFSLFQKSLRSSVYDATVQGLTDAFLNDTLKATISPAIKAWSDALKTPGTEDDQAAIAGLDAAITAANSQGQAFYSTVAPLLSRIKPVDDGTTPTDTSSSFGAVATAGQLAVGTAYLDAATLMETVATRLDNMSLRLEPKLDAFGASLDRFTRDGVPIAVEVNTNTGQQGQAQSSATRKLR